MARRCQGRSKKAGRRQLKIQELGDLAEKVKTHKGL
jgi:hypothetical protein